MTFKALRSVVVAASAMAAVVGSVSCNKGSSSNEGGGGGSAPQAVKIFKASDPNSLKLAFVTNNVSEYWKLAQGGVNKYSKETGLQVEFQRPTNGTPEEQNVILENLVNQGYNGIAVSVDAPADQVTNVNAACKKTNVLCVDSDCPKSARIEYVGTENYTAGKSLGDAIVKLLPNGGKMAVFVGTFSADNAAQRLQGIQDAIKGHNIEIVAKKEDNKDDAKARSNVEDVMNSTPDLNLVCGLWSYNGPAIASAIGSSGKKGKVLAAVFDQEQGTLDGVQAGTITCTVVQDPFGFGYEACKQLHDLATMGDAAKVPADRKILFPVQVIDAKAIGVPNEKSIGDYLKEMAAQKAS